MYSMYIYTFLESKLQIIQLCGFISTFLLIIHLLKTYISWGSDSLVCKRQSKRYIQTDTPKNTCIHAVETCK